MPYLRHIGPGSGFKVGAVVYGVIGLIAGIFCSLFAFALPAVHHAHVPWISPAIGAFAVIFCPLIYGVIGGIATLVSVLIYNLAAGWVGGLEVDIR